MISGACPALKLQPPPRGMREILQRPPLDVGERRRERDLSGAMRAERGAQRVLPCIVPADRAALHGPPVAPGVPRLELQAPQRLGNSRLDDGSLRRRQVVDVVLGRDDDEEALALVVRVLLRCPTARPGARIPSSSWGRTWT